jgi:hypothetical protein
MRNRDLFESGHEYLFNGAIRIGYLKREARWDEELVITRGSPARRADRLLSAMPPSGEVSASTLRQSINLPKMLASSDLRAERGRGINCW